MKKLLAILFVFSIVVGTLSFKTNRRPITDLPGTWTLSNEGFLVFPTADDLDTFLYEISHMNHEDAQEYLGSIGFASYGTVLFGPNNTSDVTKEQALDYLLDTAMMFQIEDIVIRPVGEADCHIKWQFVLEMGEDKLSESLNYENLRDGIFDDDKMNKFATNDPTDLVAMLTFKIETPNGHEETEPIDCATTEQERLADNPFWGWSEETCVAHHTEIDPSTGFPFTVYWREQSKYVFWLRVKTDGYFANGCSGPPRHRVAN